jgi:aminomethyltransferase
MTIRPLFEVPFERHGVIAPGLPILPRGVERHPVPGGGSRAVPVHAGDEILILDREGLQPGELVMFAPDRRSAAALLGATGHGRPDAIIATLANGSPSGAKVLRALEKSGFDLASGDAVRVFPKAPAPATWKASPRSPTAC